MATIRIPRRRFRPTYLAPCNLPPITGGYFLHKTTAHSKRSYSKKHAGKTSPNTLPKLRRLHPRFNNNALSCKRKHSIARGNVHPLIYSRYKEALFVFMTSERSRRDSMAAVSSPFESKTGETLTSHSAAVPSGYIPSSVTTTGS